MKPVNGWIIVEKIEKPKKVGSIIIPEEVKKNDKIQKSKVLQISQDVLDACQSEDRSLPYKVGDIVLHHAQTGIELVPLDTEDKTLFMKFDGVMGVIPQE